MAVGAALSNTPLLTSQDVAHGWHAVSAITAHGWVINSPELHVEQAAQWVSLAAEHGAAIHVDPAVQSEQAEQVVSAADEHAADANSSAGQPVQPAQARSAVALQTDSTVRPGGHAEEQVLQVRSIVAVSLVSSNSVAPQTVAGAH